MSRKFHTVLLRFGALNGALAMALAAAAAHYLPTVLDADALRRVQTGLPYHLLHSLALLVLAGLDGHRNMHSRALRLAACGFMLGIALFCYALYALAFTKNMLFAHIAPVGGMAFILGWLILLAAPKTAQPEPARPDNHE